MRRFLTSVLFVTTFMAGAVSASPLQQIKGGVTTVELSEAMTEALADSQLDRIKPAGIRPGEQLMRFGVSSGVLDPDTLVGEISHKGGVALSCPALGTDTVLEMQNFVVDLLGEAPVVTGVVNVDDVVLGRLPLFIPGGDEFEVEEVGGFLKLRKADLTLTEDAAALLLDTCAIDFGTEEVVGRTWTKVQLRDDSPGKGKGKDKDGDDEEEEEVEDD